MTEKTHRRKSLFRTQSQRVTLWPSCQGAWEQAGRHGTGAVSENLNEGVTADPGFITPFKLWSSFLPSSSPPLPLFLTFSFLSFLSWTTFYPRLAWNLLCNQGWSWTFPIFCYLLEMLRNVPYCLTVWCCWTQDFVPMRQALCPLNYAPSLTLWVHRLLLKTHMIFFDLYDMEHWVAPLRALTLASRWNAWFVFQINFHLNCLLTDFFTSQSHKSPPPPL